MIMPSNTKFTNPNGLTFTDWCAAAQIDWVARSVDDRHTLVTEWSKGTDPSNYRAQIQAEAAEALRQERHAKRKRYRANNALKAQNITNQVLLAAIKNRKLNIHMVREFLRVVDIAIRSEDTIKECEQYDLFSHNMAAHHIDSALMAVTKITRLKAAALHPCLKTAGPVESKEPK